MATPVELGDAVSHITETNLATSLVNIDVEPVSDVSMYDLDYHGLANHRLQVAATAPTIYDYFDQTPSSDFLSSNAAFEPVHSCHDAATTVPTRVDMPAAWVPHDILSSSESECLGQELKNIKGNESNGKRKCNSSGGDDEPVAKRSGDGNASTRFVAEASTLKSSTVTKPSKFKQIIKKTKVVPVARMVLDPVKIDEHYRNNIAQIKHVFPLLADPKLSKALDLNTKKTKWEIEDSKKTAIKVQPSRCKKWNDPEDPSITYFKVPKTQPYIGVGKKMTPVLDILEHPWKNPEYTLLKTIRGPHFRTGEQVVKEYKIKHEQLSKGQIASRLNGMISRMSKQERKDVKDYQKWSRSALRSRADQKSD